MSRRALPYRVPSDGVVKADNWTLLLGEKHIPLPDAQKRQGRAEGERVRLGSLWEEGPAVLVWLRHYG